MIINLLSVALVLGLFLYCVGTRCYKFYIFRKKMSKIPAPPSSMPIFGMTLKLLTLQKKDRINWFQNLTYQCRDGVFCTWLGPTAFIHVHKPEYLEVILRSNIEIKKSRIYRYLMPWLGYGLLTSSGTQWHYSRKLISPAFHFKILEEFAEVMIGKADILTECIEQEIKIHGDKPFDIFQLCVKAALDIICETAMGVNVHAQEAVKSDYIDAVHTISETVTYRFFRPWLCLDCLFYQTAMGKKFKNAVQQAQDLCLRVIMRKQQERQQASAKKNGPEGDKIIATHDALIRGRKKRYPDRVNYAIFNVGGRKKRVFLDLLLEANECEGNPLTIQEIRDHTNTFMFAGHDTTGALISWTLFSLGVELDIQKKVHDELDEILGHADDRTILEKLPDLKYLERVIKEALRLYPSATGVSRELTNDLVIGNYTFPKGVTVNIEIYNLHRDPSVWPDPLRFDPDRFLPENIKDRHPYAYLPFSAGPRNCIGQKYAMLEAKLTLSQVLRKFSIKSVDNHLTINKYSEIILRPVDSILVHMERRSNR